MNYQNNDIIFSTNGIERMRISNTGNVNIPSFTINSSNFTNISVTSTATIGTANITAGNITNCSISGDFYLPIDRYFYANNIGRLYMGTAGSTK